MVKSMAVNAAVAVSLLCASASAFAPAPKSGRLFATSTYSPPTTRLNALDPVTYLRTEWVSAALCTNQTPRSADKVLQLGSEDGRIVNFVPRTVRYVFWSATTALFCLNAVCGSLTANNAQRNHNELSRARKGRPHGCLRTAVETNGEDSHECSANCLYFTES